jgi:hypothetical protein
MEQIMYGPFNEQEYKALKEDLAGIKNFLPDHLAGIFWSRCNAIRGLNTPQPCTCASSARHWGSCVEDLNKFVKEIDGQI